MLVLKRKANEGILVGDVLVQVLKVTGNTVSIGIQAAPQIPILRSELVEPQKPERVA